jgi:hypothetical protein
MALSLPQLPARLAQGSVSRGLMEWPDEGVGSVHEAFAAEGFRLGSRIIRARRWCSLRRLTGGNGRNTLSSVMPSGAAACGPSLIDDAGLNRRRRTRRSAPALKPTLEHWPKKTKLAPITSISGGTTGEDQQELDFP